MTSGERAVWAAEVSRGMASYRADADRPLLAATLRAAALVLALRGMDRSKLGDDARAMLEDALSTGADR